MLPVYFLYLAGNAGGEVSSRVQRDRYRLLMNSIGFVIGFTLVFVILGATVTSLGHFFTNHRDMLRKISGAVIILFGLNFMGVFNIKMLNMERRLEFNTDRLRFPGSIIFGMVFGFGWTPCTGAFLGSALALSSNSRTLAEGLLLLLVYSAGLGIPFVLCSLVIDSAESLLKKIRKHQKAIGIVSGILLIISGILVFTDSMKYLNYIIG